MSKSWICVSALGLLIVVIGCGGSSSSSGSLSTAGGLAMSQYEALLPDGSPMELEVLHNADGVWAGEFAVAAETGPYAHQNGSCEGHMSGNNLTATCEMVDGTEFELSGTAKSDKTLSLTRSDIPGTVLSFAPVTPMATPATRADASFNLNTGGPNGRVTISTSPYSIQGGGTMTEYRGSWLGVPVTYWAYSSGYASIIIYVDPLCIITVNLASYKLSEFATATKTSDISQMTMYSTVVKAQLKLRGTCTVSP